MRPRLTKHIATILLGIFSVFLIPKEFVHALYWHTDTHESVGPIGTTSISSHHIHCSFLSYEASLFNSESSANCPKSFPHCFIFSIIEHKTVFQIAACIPSLRGPPLS
ncbi:MAG: hypothetical protein NT084_01545 [Bacteroidetes bacterium]|nr:hypothetical protein [Bacteroidota bacterium]